MSNSPKKTSDSLIRSFLVSAWAIRSHRSFLVSDLSDLLTSLIKKREWANRSFFKKQKPYIKHTKNILKFFEQITHLLIYHERPERITHSRSFVMSNLSDSLTVALLIWATWAIPSQSLTCLERSERIAHSRSFDLRNEQMSNERIPSPAPDRHNNTLGSANTNCWYKYCECTFRRRLVATSTLSTV